MKRFLSLVAAVVALSACGAEQSTSSSNSSSSSGAGSSSSSPAAASTDIAVGNSSLGMVLVNSSGRTLYYFTPEQGGHLQCATGACVSTWPLLVVSGAPTAASGISGQLGVVSTPDGKSEATYNGWPLHTYSGDAGAGDVKGQGIGGKWFAATPTLSAGGSAGSPSPSGTYSPY